MKKKSINLNAPILILVCLLAGFLMSRYYKNKRESLNNQFEEFGLFTIGKVVEYGPKAYIPMGGYNSPYIKFVYKVDGIELKTSSDYYVPDNNGPKKGEQFMAIFLPDKPDRCALLLDYPVKDSTDYNRYVEEFKKHPIKLKE